MGANAEIAREGLGRWSAGDIEGALATMHPDVEWHAVFELPDLPHGKEVYRGREEVMVLWNAFRSVWDEITIELDEILHDQGETLIARAHFHARGGASGVELEQAVFYVFEIDEQGLLARLRPFDRPDQARAAAGLES